MVAYAVTFWSFAADVGVTDSFPWHQGPLSNWMVWFILTLGLTLVAAKFRLNSRFGTAAVKQQDGRKQNPIENEFVTKAPYQSEGQADIL